MVEMITTWIISGRNAKYWCAVAGQMNLDPELGLIKDFSHKRNRMCFVNLFTKVVQFPPVRLVVGSRPIPGIGAQGLKGAPRLSVWTHVVKKSKNLKHIYNK